VRARVRTAKEAAALKADALLSCEARLVRVEDEAAAAAARADAAEADAVRLRVRRQPLVLLATEHAICEHHPELFVQPHATSEAALLAIVSFSSDRCRPRTSSSLSGE
jgi:hypothetical protein